MNFTADILAEALLHTGLPVFKEITLYATLLFEAMPEQAALAAAIKGAIAALVMWLALGRIVTILSEKKGWKPIEKTKKSFHKAGWFMPMALLFSFTPAGFMIAFAAGIFRTSLLSAFPAILFAQAIYYYGMVAQSY